MANRVYYTPPGAVPDNIPDPCECDEFEGHIGEHGGATGQVVSADLASDWEVFDKGYTPPPFMINHETGNVVRITFETSPFTQTCACSIECTSSATSFDESLQTLGFFCPEKEDFEVVLTAQTLSEDDVTVYQFIFQDANGNQSTVDVNSVASVIPVAPMANLETSDSGRRSHFQIGVPVYSHTYKDLRDSVTQYQVERYIRNTDNRQIWVDWTPTEIQRAGHILGGKDRVHWDLDVPTGVQYGYRVRFRSTFDHASQWSAWTIIQG